MTWNIYYSREVSKQGVDAHNHLERTLAKAKNSEELSDDEREELAQAGVTLKTKLERQSPPELVLTVEDADFQDADGNCIWLPPDDPPWTPPGKKGGIYSYEKVP